MHEQFYLCQDNVKLRYAHFQAPTNDVRGTVLCLHGRRECLEVYLEQILELNARGFDVITFDWRGQGGSDRPLPDRHKHHVTSFVTYREDLHAFYTDIVTPHQRGPLIVYAHSMGGFIALDWFGTNKPPVAAAILFAPMLVLPLSSWLYGPLFTLAKPFLRVGLAENYIPGDGPFDPDQWVFEGNPLTHDPQRFQIIPCCFKARPELALGGITWGWLCAALEAIPKVRAHLPFVPTRTLVLNSGQDHVTPSAELSLWTHCLPYVTEKIYPTARHVLLMETDDLRQQAWRDIDAFLEETITKQTP